MTAEQIDVPGAQGTVVNGVNDAGVMVGVYLDAKNAVHGFLMEGGSVTKVDVPGADSTYAQSINNLGNVAGDFTNKQGQTLGFVRRSGKYEMLRCPHGEQTYVTGMNSDGLIVGACIDGKGKSTAFQHANGVFSPLISNKDLVQLTKRVGISPKVGTGATPGARPAKNYRASGMRPIWGHTSSRPRRR